MKVVLKILFVLFMFPFLTLSFMLEYPLAVILDEEDTLQSPFEIFEVFL